MDCTTLEDISQTRNIYSIGSSDNGFDETCFYIDNYTTKEDILEKDKISTVVRLDKMSTKDWNYSGVLYSNCFRAHQSINLIGLGFYGPASDNYATYFVDVEIEENSTTRNIKSLASIKRKKINAERREIFVCDLERPLLIRQGKWYNIKFQLDGPPTCRGLNHLQTASSNTVKFDFYRGSSQMPCIIFSTNS